MPALSIAVIAPRNNVFLAPMTGVSDLPFRRLAHTLGAGLVVSEMVASAEFIASRPDVRRRAEVVISRRMLYNSSAVNHT